MQSVKLRSRVALALALVAACCIGAAVVTSKFGLRHLDAWSGAAISIPSATVMLLMLSPFMWQPAFVRQAALVFAVVGIFYPAAVTLLRFYSTDRLGPATTSSVLASGSPLFAVGAAALLLQEEVSGRIVAATCGIAAGIFLMSFRAVSPAAAWSRWWLILPFAASLVAGCAQAGIKAGLLLWPSPFAAALIGYVVSSVLIVALVAARRRKPTAWPVAAVSWFAGTGVLNGAGVFSLFAALSGAPVSLVSPIFAAYPLVTLLLGSAVLNDEPINARRIAGALLTVGSIAYLVSS